MSWRTIVISNSAKLDYQLGFMVVRGEETVKIHIQEIEVLIVENTAVSLTTCEGKDGRFVLSLEGKELDIEKL